MKNKRNEDIETIMRDGKLIDAALVSAVREALRRHHQAAQPVAEWRDGKTVWLEPAEIERRIEEIDQELKQKDSATLFRETKA